jgi:hypothetical protein
MELVSELVQEQVAQNSRHRFPAIAGGGEAADIARSAPDSEDERWLARGVAGISPSGFFGRTRCPG